MIQSVYFKCMKWVVLGLVGSFNQQNPYLIVLYILLFISPRIIALIGFLTNKNLSNIGFGKDFYLKRKQAKKRKKK